MSLSLVILAAGIGSRYGGLKQIDPVGPAGEIVVDYSIFDARRAGFDRVVFVIRREIEKDFRDAIGRRIESQIAVDYAFQQLDDLPGGFSVPPGRVKPWGTGHAIRAARHAVTGNFAAVNADDFYGRASYAAIGDFLRATPPGTPAYALAAFTLRNTLSENGTVARGVCELDSRGFLTRVTERTRIERDGAGGSMTLDDGSRLAFTGDELVSMNSWGFTPTLFPFLEEQLAAFLPANAGNPKSEFYIPSVVDTLIRENRATARVLQTPDKWFGVTYPADKPVVVEAIRELIRSGAYPAPLWG
jgi:NDP-sugar pyrophosphorylase family protein